MRSALALGLVLALSMATEAPARRELAQHDIAAPTLVPIPRPNPLRPHAIVVNPRFYASPSLSVPTTLCPSPYAGTNRTATIPGSTDGSAVYGSNYGQNYGAGPGSTLDQSSAVLGSDCAPRPASPLAQPGTGQPWQPQVFTPYDPPPVMPYTPAAPP